MLLFGFTFQNNFRNLIRTTKFSVSRPTLFRYCLVFRPLSPATEKPYEQTLFRRLNPQFELSHFYLFLNFFFSEWAEALPGLDRDLGLNRGQEVQKIVQEVVLDRIQGHEADRDLNRF